MDLTSGWGSGKCYKVINIVQFGHWKKKLIIILLGLSLPSQDNSFMCFKGGN